MQPPIIGIERHADAAYITALHHGSSDFESVIHTPLGLPSLSRTNQAGEDAFYHSMRSRSASHLQSERLPANTRQA